MGTRDRGTVSALAAPGRGRTGTAPRGEVPQRNVEDSHSALQEMQACLAETDKRDHLLRARDELNKRIVLQKFLVSRQRRWGLRCPLARTPVGDRGVSSRVPEHHQGPFREDR